MKKTRFIVKLFVALALFLAVPVPVAADILILPIRTVFKDRERMKNIAVVNKSDKAATFRMSLFYQEQTADGSYKKLDGPLNPAADFSKMMTFSPRQVSLPAYGKQAIRLALRRPADLPEGEYRVHLRLQRLDGDQKVGLTGKNGKGVSLQMGINVGFAVPIILRHGKYDSAATISDPVFTRASADGKTLPKVEFTINRTGKYSTLGKVEVFWTPLSGGEEKKVGILNNANVFPELTKRSMKVSLNDKTISGGTLRIVYDGDDADAGLHFDEKSFPIR